AGRAPLRAEVDAWFDSAAIAHDTRWDLVLPSRDEVFDYYDQVHRAVRARFASSRPSDPSDADLYFAQLSLLHEEMHAEAFAYTRQTLALTAPGRDEGVAAEPPSFGGDRRSPSRVGGSEAGSLARRRPAVRRRRDPRRHVPARRRADEDVRL